jgi:hypothetical protein
MTDPKKNDLSRRKFLSFGLMAGAWPAAAGKAEAQNLSESGETVKMLTTDGKLVEVDKAALDKAGQRKRASKKDILEWIHPSE